LVDSKERYRGWWFDRLVLAVCLAIIGMSFVLGADERAVYFFGWELPYRCASREILGFACPGCGLTRAFVLTAHGSPGLATEVHPLGAFGWFALAAQIPWRGWKLFRRSDA